jgi:CRISPR type III-A-associated RAMP protein Csm4
MNPGLVVKLRPSGPWRIGPDSGARNRVDSIYHSDSLYSAVSGAMLRLGSLDGWLSATARAAAPAVCFSSCFPFLDEIGFVVPPRSIWPPASPALLAARVRWKSARFVPLGIVQAMLAGQTLNEHQWTVDGPSQCLVPAGRPGPFRIDTRWNAAVDRFTGATERHSTACLEFRPGAGLWTVVSFLDDAARDQWLDPVKAAFRLLADTGFGGERSRGWGRSETPEFIEGLLPDLILPPAPVRAAPAPAPAAVLPSEEVLPEIQPVPEVVAEPEAAAEPDAVAQPETAEEPPAGTAQPAAAVEAEALAPPELAAAPATAEVPSEAAAQPEAAVEAEAIAPPEPAATPAPAEEPPAADNPEITAGQASVEAPPDVAPLIVEPETPPAEAPSAPPEPEASTPAPPLLLDAAPVQLALKSSPEPAALIEAALPVVKEPAPVVVAAPEGVQLHWMLSLFCPAPGDAVDWARGSYSVLPRGGRVESPAGSGELKKLVQMVTEGSVLCAGNTLTGAAPDVAPDGFAHPVFRAGFAVAIPLPKVRS